MPIGLIDDPSVCPVCCFFCPRFVLDFAGKIHTLVKIYLRLTLKNRVFPQMGINAQHLARSTATPLQKQILFFAGFLQVLARLQICISPSQ